MLEKHRLRKSKGWSQEELGDKLGVTRQTISKWELGDPIFKETALNPHYKRIA